MKRFSKSGVGPVMLPTSSHSSDGVLCDVAVGDISGSMSSPAFVKRESKRKTMQKAIESYLTEKSKNRPQDMFALVAYHHMATVCCPFLNVRHDRKQLRQALKEMASIACGSTDLYTGLEEAENLIVQWSSQAGVQSRVLAYSDGFDGSPDKAIEIANSLKRMGVIIETFGVEERPENVDEAFLKEVATRDSDGFVHYRFLGDAETIQDTFNELAHGTLTVD